jgi:hypothetical protein
LLSTTFGLRQEANAAFAVNVSATPRLCLMPLLSLSSERGVGHPPQPVSDMRRADARSRDRDCPEVVTQGFQV